MQPALPFWQRLLATIAVVVGVSFVAGLLWYQILGFELPSYLGGLVGGLAALPVWSFLKRVGPSNPDQAPPV
jgi:hypothetical protein